MKFSKQEKAFIKTQEFWFDEGSYCVHPAGDEIHKEAADDFLIILDINNQTSTFRATSLEAAFEKVRGVLDAT